MKSLVLVVLFCYSLAAQTCVPANISAAGCTSALGATGDVTGSLPLVKALKAQSYSTHVNAADEKADVYYVKALSVANTTTCIIVWFHGGGFTLNTQSTGDFDGIAGYVIPVEVTGCTFVSVGYTWAAASAGTAMPTQIKQANCALHWVANQAGTLFPGNKNDIRVGGFSAGSYLAATLLWDADHAGRTDCEYSDTYTVTSGAMIAPWTGTMSGWDNGTYAITAASYNAGTGKVTATLDHNIVTNSIRTDHGIIVSGASPAGYNVGTPFSAGGCTGPSVPVTPTSITSNTITYAVGSNPGAWVSGGVARDANTEDYVGKVQCAWNCVGEAACTTATTGYAPKDHITASSPRWWAVSGDMDTTLVPAWNGVEALAQCRAVGASCTYSVIHPSGTNQAAHFIDSLDLLYNSGAANGFPAPAPGCTPLCPGWSFSGLVNALSGAYAPSVK